MRCPSCKEEFPVIKAGKRKITTGIVQKFFCKDCSKYFTDRNLPHGHYPVDVVFTALTFYNNGYSVDGSIDRISDIFDIRIPRSTFYSWLKGYRSLLSFVPVRMKMRTNNQELIDLDKMRSDRICCHEKKVRSILGKHKSVCSYIGDVSSGKFDDIFRSGDHYEGCTFEVPSDLKETFEDIPYLLRMGEDVRIGEIEDENLRSLAFILINDKATVALNVPLFLEPEKFPNPQQRSPVISKIDLLRITNGTVSGYLLKNYIKDPYEHLNETYISKRMMSERLGMPRSQIDMFLLDRLKMYKLS